MGTHSPEGRDAAKQHQDTGVEIPRAEVVSVGDSNLF